MRTGRYKHVYGSAWHVGRYCRNPTGPRGGGGGKEGGRRGGGERFTSVGLVGTGAGGFLTLVVLRVGGGVDVAPSGLLQGVPLLGGLLGEELDSESDHAGGQPEREFSLRRVIVEKRLKS